MKLNIPITIRFFSSHPMTAMSRTLLYAGIVEPHHQPLKHRAPVKHIDGGGVPWA